MHIPEGKLMLADHALKAALPPKQPLSFRISCTITSKSSSVKIGSDPTQA